MSRCRTLALLALVLFGMLPASLALAGEESFGGVGLQVVPTIDGELVVLNVLEKAPAAQQGLRPGDLIYQVGDFPLRGSDFGKVVAERLWGPVGSSVELRFRRPGVAGESRVVLQRSSIDPRLTVTPTLQQAAPAAAGSQ